jgi:hypothetical protein
MAAFDDMTCTGTVKFSNVWDGKRRSGLDDSRRQARLRSHRHAGDLGPGDEGLAASGMKRCGGVLVGTTGKNVGDLIMTGRKPRHLPRRLEALHDPLSSSRRLVGILRPVIEAFVLTVLDAWHDLMSGLSRDVCRWPSWVCACVSGTNLNSVLEAHAFVRYCLNCLDHSLSHHADQRFLPDQSDSRPLPTIVRQVVTTQLPL